MYIIMSHLYVYLLQILSVYNAQMRVCFQETWYEYKTQSEGTWRKQTIAIYISRMVGGDAIVLGKLPVPGRPTYLDQSRARAYCACIRCGRGLFGHFSFSLSLSLSLSLFLSGRRPDIDKYCLKGP